MVLRAILIGFVLAGFGCAQRVPGVGPIMQVGKRAPVPAGWIDYQKRTR